MIPDYQSLMRPVLEAAKTEPRRISEVIEQIADNLDLSADERAELLPSGRTRVIVSRVHWAKTYLQNAGLVRSVKRGWYATTERGLAALSDPSLTINTAYLKQFDSFVAFQTGGARAGKSTTAQTDLPSQPAAPTPEEAILAAYEDMNSTLAENLLSALRSGEPQFFEAVIVDLLLAMGYGGSWGAAGRALGQSGDNGVDGVIDQDPLGVDQIYLQAKRYAENNAVGPSSIRDFFGALNLRRATKGIFITTSHFTPAAEGTAADLGSRIVLIDGKRLAQLMIQHSIGCRPKQVLDIKEIDEAYFDPDGALD